jgi:hypothetical protein
MMAAQASCTMNGSPSATWPRTSVAACTGAAENASATTPVATAPKTTYITIKGTASSSVSHARFIK